MSFDKIPKLSYGWTWGGDSLIPTRAPTRVIIPFNTRNVEKPFPKLKRTVQVDTPFARNVGDGRSHCIFKSASLNDPVVLV